jgi:hypothetical protein
LDLAPLAYVLMAAAFYPALAWFLIPILTMIDRRMPNRGRRWT